MGYLKDSVIKRGLKTNLNDNFYELKIPVISKEDVNKNRFLLVFLFVGFFIMPLAASFSMIFQMSESEHLFILFPLFSYLGPASFLYFFFFRKLFQYKVLQFSDSHITVFDEQFGKLKEIGRIDRYLLTDLIISKASRTELEGVLDSKIELKCETGRIRIAEHLSKSSFDKLTTVYQSYKNGVDFKELDDTPVTKSESAKVDAKNQPTQNKLEKAVHFAKIIVPIYLIIPITASLLSLSESTIHISRILAIASFICLFPVVLGGGLWIQQLIGKPNITFFKLIKHIPNWSKVLSVVSVVYYILVLNFADSSLSGEKRSIGISEAKMGDLLQMLGMLMLFPSIYLSSTLGQLRYLLAQKK